MGFFPSGRSEGREASAVRLFSSFFFLMIAAENMGPSY